MSLLRFQVLYGSFKKMKASVRQKTELLATTTTVVGKSTHLELISAINDEAISDFDEVVFAFQTWHVENIEG